MDVVPIKPKRLIDGRQLSPGTETRVVVVQAEGSKTGYALKVLMMLGVSQTNLRLIVPEAGGDPFTYKLWSSANGAGNFAKEKDWLIAETTE